MTNMCECNCLSAFIIFILAFFASCTIISLFGFIASLFSEKDDIDDWWVC